MDEWKFFQILICKIKTHRISNQTQIVLIRLLPLVRCITTRKSRTKSVPLDGAGKNNRWLSLVGACCCICSVNLEEIMTAEIFGQRFKFFIGVVSDHGRQFLTCKQFFANDGPFCCEQSLLVPIDKISETLGERSARILCKECVP